MKRVRVTVSWRKKKMSRKIKVELTKKQYFIVTMTLNSHCFDIDGQPDAATEKRVINNAVDAMNKRYEEWKEGK